MTRRGKNFTEKEKSKLLDLVQRHLNIIENKCTNAVTTRKKNETWESITAEFNITAAEVPRTPKQLYTAYLNFKRSTRQHSASSWLHLTNENKGVADGDTKPVLISIAPKMCPAIGDQEKPLSNDGDSVSRYGSNDLTETSEVPVITTTCNCIRQSSNEVKNRKKLQQKLKNIIKANDIFKRQYYRKMLECATLEKRTKLLEYKMALKKNALLDLEIKIKEKEYQNIC